MTRRQKLRTVLARTVLGCFFCSSFAFAQTPERSYYVSVIQSPPVLESRTALTQMIADARQMGIKKIFLQVYRGNQSWFLSQVADETPYYRGEDAMGEDAIALVLRESHAAGLEVHAWLNLLSLSTNEYAPLLEKFGPSILTRNREPKRAIKDYMVDSQYFLEPSDMRVRTELLKLVEEVLTQYPELDGIHFDYIRYPDTHPAYGYSEDNLKRFSAKTGIPADQVNEKLQAWRDWKRDQVTELLTALVKKSREIRPGIQVSSTGCMTLLRALEEAFQNWPVWLESGLVDFVSVMSYPGDAATFQVNLNSVKERVPQQINKVIFSAPAYKLVKQPEIFHEQFSACEKLSPLGCAVFHYGSLLENPELKNLRTVLEKKGTGYF